MNILSCLSAISFHFPPLEVVQPVDQLRHKGVPILKNHKMTTVQLHQCAYQATRQKYAI